jgi:hypothetical protein
VRRSRPIFAISVLADERYDVGERSDRGDLDEPRHPRVVACLPAQRLHQFQRDADAGKVLIGVAAVVALRIDHGERAWQRRVGLVMIRDDQIDPELAGAQRRLRAADAAVDRDDQRDAAGVQPFDRHRLQPVAVAQAFGDEVHDVGAEQFERAPQNDRRGHAVDVVVAMDRDPLASRDRAEDAIDRRPHPRQRHRIVQLIERRVQKPRCRLRVRQTALTQEPRHNRRDANRRREGVRGGHIARQGVPPWSDYGHPERLIRCFRISTQRTQRTRRPNPVSTSVERRIACK